HHERPNSHHDHRLSHDRFRPSVPGFTGPTIRPPGPTPVNHGQGLFHQRREPLLGRTAPTPRRVLRHCVVSNCVVSNCVVSNCVVRTAVASRIRSREYRIPHETTCWAPPPARQTGPLMLLP